MTAKQACAVTRQAKHMNT